MLLEQLLCLNFAVTTWVQQKLFVAVPRTVRGPSAVVHVLHSRRSSSDLPAARICYQYLLSSGPCFVLALPGTGLVVANPPASVSSLNSRRCVGRAGKPTAEIHIQMAVELGDAADAAANLALRMGSTAADAIIFMADVGEKLPFLEPVLGTIKAIREKVETVNRNREQLAALEQRCTYITACIIEKRSRSKADAEVDVTPLRACVEAIEAFVEVCGRTRTRRGRFRRIVKASDDKNEISGLNARVDRLTGDLGLSGIVIMENKVDNLKAILVSCDSMYVYVSKRCACSCS